ncbi:hypothetical protein F5X98DRAFT_373385 [Xylaria grammica]|nr:hypothetical protein F5X98DRAFT_373385 [Xylaria grammica]
MAEPSKTESDTSPQRYHRHPLFLHLPLEEAIKQGLAVPVSLDGNGDGVGRGTIKLRELRPAKSIHNFRPNFSVTPPTPEYRTDYPFLAEPPPMPKNMDEVKGESPSRIARLPKRAAKVVKKSLSLGRLRDDSNSSIPDSTDTEVTEDVKKKIHDKVQDSVRGLKDRLEQQQKDVPNSPSLNGGQKNAAPVLLSTEENNGHNVHNVHRQNSDTAETEFPAVPSLPSTSTEVLAAGQPQCQARREPHSQVQGNLQANAHKTQVEEGSTTPGQRVSSLNAPAKVPFHYYPAPNRIRTRAPAPPPKGLGDISLLGSFDEPLPPLPRYLRPENQHSPRPSLCPSPCIAFAASAVVYNDETGTATEVPLKMGGRIKLSHKPSKDQGRAFGVSKQHSRFAVRDFSLPSSTASPHALVDPYEAEFISTNVDNNSHTNAIKTNTRTATAITDTDGDVGGWLANHKRIHRHAIAQYLAADGAAEKAPSYRSHASVELKRMATKTSTGGCNDAAAGSDRPAGPEGDKPLPKASFMERCGKALKKKRSFWRNKENEE